MLTWCGVVGHCLVVENEHVALWQHTEFSVAQTGAGCRMQYIGCRGMGCGVQNIRCRVQLVKRRGL